MSEVTTLRKSATTVLANIQMVGADANGNIVNVTPTTLANCTNPRQLNRLIGGGRITMKKVAKNLSITGAFSKGDTITVSCHSAIDTDTDNDLRSLKTDVFLVSPNKWICTVHLKKSSTLGLYTGTAVLNTNMPTTPSRVRFVIISGPLDTELYNVEVEGLSLVKGDMPLPFWVPAPEELSEKLTLTSDGVD